MKKQGVDSNMDEDFNSFELKIALITQRIQRQEET